MISRLLLYSTYIQADSEVFWRFWRFWSLMGTIFGLVEFSASVVCSCQGSGSNNFLILINFMIPSDSLTLLLSIMGSLMPSSSLFIILWKKTQCCLKRYWQQNWPKSGPLKNGHFAKTVTALSVNMLQEKVGHGSNTNKMHLKVH